MKQVLPKIKISIIILRVYWSDIMNNVWKKDLDERYCCSGRDCCCFGKTIREAFLGEEQ